jgi:hypothetical protein
MKHLPLLLIVAALFGLAQYTPPGGGGGVAGVSSLNSLTGALSLTAGSNISITPSGSNVAVGSSAATVGFIGGYIGESQGILGGATNYVPPFPQFNSLPESASETPLGVACTAGNLILVTHSSQPSDGTLVVTLRQNAASPANGPVVTIPASGAAGVYKDTTDTVALAATDLIDYEYVNNSASFSAARQSIGFVCK